MTDWQPIATAPKDGTLVLAWDGKDLAIVAWDWHWSVVHDAEDYVWSTYEPSHWQSLPAPPEVQK